LVKRTFKLIQGHPCWCRQ